MKPGQLWRNIDGQIVYLIHQVYPIRPHYWKCILYNVGRWNSLTVGLLRESETTGFITQSINERSLWKWRQITLDEL